MIVKKLSDVKGGGFPGAGYNERKVAEGVAELMAMENISDALRHKIEVLHHFGLDAASEIERYLKARSQTYGNTTTTRFQFHVSASVKGRVMSAEELTDFARQLMKGMGYARQPYFVYYHHDTENNHVHILSTRIQPNGFPISDHQDIRWLNECANRILASDIDKDIAHIFSYNYETEGQFANIIRSHGYKIGKVEDGYRLFKNGGDAGNISDNEIKSHLSKDSQKRKDRAKQLKAIIKKYKAEITEGKYQSLNNPEVSKSHKKKPKLPKVNSDIKKILDSNGKPLNEERQQQIQQLIDILKTSFGIDVYFQKDKNGQVRGYGLVDHAEKIAFDGSKVMRLSELIDFTLKPERKPTPLDVYRSLFTAEIISDGTNDSIHISTVFGDTYQTVMSANQSAWYRNTKPEDKEDVALMIASTAFTEEILLAYLSRQPIQNHLATIQSVSAVKQRGGKFALRIVTNDGMSMMIPMDDQDESRYRILSPKDTQDFLNNLAVHYLTREDARSIIQRIRQTTKDQTTVRVLPQSKDFTSQMAKVFSINLASSLLFLNVDTGRGENREWEVGTRHRSDAMDNQSIGSTLII